MKVLFISTFGTGFKGGGIISAALMADYLRGQGMDVRVEYVRRDEPRTLSDRLLRLIPIRLYNMRTPFLDYLIRRRIEEYVSEHHADIVDIQDRFSITALAGHRLGGVRKIFTVIDVLSSEQARVAQSWYKYLLLNMDRKAIIRGLKREDHIVTNSKYTADTLVAEGIDPGKITTIYRSLPPRSWYDLPEEERREGEGEARTPLNFLMPGRISREKGVLEVIDVMTSLNGEGKEKEFKVTLIGNGPLLDVVKKRKEKERLSNLEIVDPVPVEEMLGYYREADVVLMPILYKEAFGRVALEALILGKPLIVNPQGGIREILETAEGGCVLVHDSGDVKKAMEGFISNPALVEEMRILIRERRDAIRKRFNHENLYRRYSAYYGGSE